MSVKELLIKHGFHFNKAFGQNFISDYNLLSAIVEDSGVTEEDIALEIGCGAGTLTSALAERSAKVVGYEIDESLRPVLFEALLGHQNVEIRYKDFMREDNKALEECLDAVVVANLPYYITTPILMRLLEGGIGKSITVMVQKEVADRLVAKAGSKEYGAITVKVGLLGGARITRIVSRNMFYPAPNVDSAVVRIDRLDRYRGKDASLTDELIRSAFLMRRKTLQNNLAKILPKEELCRMLEGMGLKGDIRGEVLTADQFVALSDLIYDYRNRG